MWNKWIIHKSTLNEYLITISQQGNQLTQARLQHFQGIQKTLQQWQIYNEFKFTKELRHNQKKRIGKRNF